MEIALYARVSTNEQQTLPMQLKAMRDYAKKRKWKIKEEVQEIGFAPFGTLGQNLLQYMFAGCANYLTG